MKLFVDTYQRLNLEVRCFQCGKKMDDVALKHKYTTEYIIFCEPHKCAGKKEEDEDDG